MNEIRFMVTGQDAEAGAKDIKKIINHEFEYNPQISTEQKKNAEGDTKAVDPLAVAALIVAVPAAVLAVADLVQRIKHKQKLDRALANIQKQVIQKKKVTVKITYPDGTVKELHATDSTEILDQFSQ